MEMSRILVTGATGFIGRQVVSLLLRDGHEVRALARTESDRDRIESAVSFLRADVRDAEAVASLMGDAEAVVHLASSFRPEEAVDVVQAGTRTVVAAAKKSAVDRLVFVSCLPAQAAAESPFYRAKWRGEQLVRGSGVPYVILRPSLVVGAGDSVTRPLAEIIRAFPVIPLPIRGLLRQQPADIEDVARCIQLAVTKDELLNREISICGPAFLTIRQLIDLIQGQVGSSKPKLLLPRGLVPALAGLLPAAARHLFTGARLAGFDQPTNAASPGIVWREFGFEPRSIVSRLGTYL